jgi:hypothetical protein
LDQDSAKHHLTRVYPLNKTMTDGGCVIVRVHQRRPISPLMQSCRSPEQFRQDPPRMRSTLMFYRFTKRMIQRNELTQFLHIYDPASLEPWRYLPTLFGRMCFSFDGYDDTWQIDPNLRRFWRVLNECWPYWVLFCDLGQRDLRFMTMGCLQSFRAITVEGQNNAAIFFDRDELNHFLDQQFHQTFERCRFRRGIKRTLQLRRKAIAEYFRQPLQAVRFTSEILVQACPVPARSRAAKFNFWRR